MISPRSQLATQWKEPKIIRNQLEETRAEDPKGLSSALEKALLTKSADVVKV